MPISPWENYGPRWLHAGEWPWVPFSGPWVEWKGGEQPLPANTSLMFLFRYERAFREWRNTVHFAEDLDWEHTGCGTDIVAYVVLNRRY